MQPFPTSPLEPFQSLRRNKTLVIALVKREIAGRYRGSLIGTAWSLFNPLLMLIIYTFVFSIVFKARWSVGDDQGKAGFAIIFFAGLIVHGFFAECVNRSPMLILSNVNYVKKVIFPLEILPWVSLGSVLFHTAISVLVLIIAQAAVYQKVHYTVVFFPMIIMPLALGTMGFSWFLAALGVYLRDISQITGVFTTILLFVSPVFYPISALPDKYQNLLKLNPLAYIIQEGRNVLIFGLLPDIGQWAAMMVVGFTVAWAGFAWFQKTRKGFADVV